MSWDDLAVAKQMLENAKKKQAFTGTHVSPTSGFVNPNARRQYDKTRPTSPGDYKKGKYYDPGYPDRRAGTYKASPYNQDSAKARTMHPVSASYMAQGPTNIDVKMFVEQKPEGITGFYCNSCRNPEPHNKKKCYMDMTWRQIRALSSNPSSAEADEGNQESNFNDSLNE